MDRRTAIEAVALLATAVVSVNHAREIAEGIDRSVYLELLGLHPEKIVGTVYRPESRPDGLVTPKRVPWPGVAIFRLGAEACIHLGLYAGPDHAFATPFAPQYEGRQRAAKYVGERAAMRLAYHFWGRDGCSWLRERVPVLDRYVVKESQIDRYFLRTAHPGRTPTAGS